jgi:RNA polymerase sigma factor (sigma-70 family)
MASSTPSPSANEPLPPVGGFRTTHWSAVLLAGRDSLPDARAALEELCRSYWYPLYAFARRKGCGHEDAQDLVQGFFAQLLARRDLADVHPDKGRFRTFLLSSLGHFMANEWDRAQAQKRGGGIQFVTLEPGDSDERYLREPASDTSPEALYDRTWAQQVLASVLGRLRDESTRDGSSVRYEALKGFLLGDRGGEPYSELARRLGTTESGIKSAVHRLRQRFRELFREEIARTVGNVGEVDDELRHLITTMSQ